MFRKKDNGKHKISTCIACQYPKCHTCGIQHPESAKPIRKNCESRLGQQWYCAKDACQKAMRGRVQQEKGKQP